MDDDDDVIAHGSATASPDRRIHFHPLLVEQRIVIKGNDLFALYPITATRCTTHSSYTEGHKRLIQVAGHIASHLKRFKLDDGGVKVRDFDVLHVCDCCGYTSHSDKMITDHLIKVHNIEPFQSGFTDLADVCAKQLHEDEIVFSVPFASDQKALSPNEAPAPSLSRHTKQGLHPILKQNRFAIRSREMFVLYPLSNIVCSLHPSCRFDLGNSLPAANHAASRAHLDLTKVLTDGTKVSDFLLIFVCEACHICYLDVKNMKKHFEAEHMDRSTSSTATTDLLTVCTDLIPETDEVCNPALKFILDSPDVRLIGKLAYNTLGVLGEGSCGTFVFKGLFENRDDVAVKRVQICPQVDAVNEIELLRSLEHENIVKYYVTERDLHFTYIAITLAEASLHDFIKDRAKYPAIVLSELKIFKDCCGGLSYLHHYENNESSSTTTTSIIHRDIKPHNILLTRTSSGQSKAMLSDFGIAKKHSLDVTQTLSTGTKGTEGWIAPEVMNSGVHTPSSDIFSMGCVAFFIFSGGQHPFGERNERNQRIAEAELNMRPIARVDIGIYSVLHSMLSNKSEWRPPIASVLKHPIFWTTMEKLQFLVRFSNSMENMDGNCQLRLSLERDAEIVLNESNWRSSLEHFSVSIIKELEMGRKKHHFSGDSVFDLVRAIRNKANHFASSKMDMKMLLGGTDEKMFEFFNIRFPRLIYHCYVVAQMVRQDHAHYYSGNSFLFPFLPKVPEIQDNKSLSSDEPEVIVID